MDKHMEVFFEKYDLLPAPMTPQLFGNAGKEHMEKYGKELILTILMATPI